jgi:2-C-methyl-D-erythritol 4-phosphate cytidylyltransferase
MRQRRNSCRPGTGGPTSTVSAEPAISSSTVDLSVIVPLPAALVEDKAAAFATLAGEATLVRVVRSSLGAGDHAEPPRVVVAAAKQLADEARGCLAAHGLSSVTVIAANDPGTRKQCLMAGLEYLASVSISAPYVLVHDHRWPIVSTAVCDRVVAPLRSGAEFVVPALPLVDSVKTVNSLGSVSVTVDRSTLRTVQYPRGFASNTLSQLLSGCTADHFDELDEAIRAGLPVTIVEGDPDAFVVAVPRDAELVEVITSVHQTDRG